MYKYKIRDKFGTKLSGLMEGEDKDQVAKHLVSMGYTIILVEEARTAPVNKFMQKLYRPRLRAVGVFTRQFATLTKSGLTVLASLNTLEKQTKEAYLKQIINQVSKEIESGSSLSAALANHPNTFDGLYVNTVKAGEASGMLDEVLNRLADLTEHEIDTKSKILGVMLYPVISACFLCTGFLVLTTFVLPQFVRMFDTLKGKLPLPTLILIKTNYIVHNYWYVILAAAGFSIFGFLTYVKTVNGRRTWDGFKLKIPVIGPLIQKIAMSRFSHIFAMLVKSGVPILTILDITGRTAGNVIISQAIENIKNSVKEGKGIAEPMRISGIFTPMVTQMVAIGEETGKIDELLFEVSVHYDKEVEYGIKYLSTMIEPALIVILAVGVLIMALGVFLPMWNMFSLIKGGA